jgi:biliverdin reductase
MIRIAILGSGRVANARVRELNLRKDAVVIGIASSDLGRAKKLAEPIGAIATTDWRSLVSQSDAVMICSLNQFHAEMCEFSLNLDKHVSVDYPLAITLSDTKKLIDLAQSKNVVLHVEHIELLSPWFNTLMAALPQIGLMLNISWTNLNSRQATDMDWTFDRASGSSFFIHAATLSRLIRLAGSASWVSANEKLLNLEGSRFAGRITTTQIGFENGVIAQLLDGQALTVPPISSRLSVIGTEGQLIAEKHEQVILHLQNRSDPLPISTITGLFGKDIDNFLKQVQDKRKSYVSLEQVYLLAKLARACELSCQKNQQIQLKDL